MSSIKCREQAKRQQDGANFPSGNTEYLGGGGTQNPSVCCLMIGEKQQLCAKIRLGATARSASVFPAFSVRGRYNREPSLAMTRR